MLGWTSILTTIVPSLAPVVIQGIGNLVNKITGGPKPNTIDDVIKLQTADVEKLKALALLDTPSGTLSQWVVDLRGSFRYIAALVLILAAVVTLLVPGLATLSAIAVDLASSAFFFIFGSKVLEGYNATSTSKK